MKAVWGTDYDFIMDECYKCPVCPKCEEPIGKMKDGKYHCFSCGEVVEVVESDMKEYFAEREGEKVEMEDCFPSEVKMKNGETVKMGCGGKKCMETHYIKNPVSKEWQTAWGECTRCGRRFIV